MNTEKTGEYIRNKRKNKKWNQEDLADAVGVSVRTIANWESGKEIKSIYYDTLAKALDITQYDLIAGKDLNLDSETRAEFDRRLKDTNEVTIVLEDNGIFTLDVATAALGLAIIAMALGLWAAFKHTTLLFVLCILNGILGIAFLFLGRKLIKKMEKKLNEKKTKSSVS